MALQPSLSMACRYIAMMKPMNRSKKQYRYLPEKKYEIRNTKFGHVRCTMYGVRCKYKIHLVDIFSNVSDSLRPTSSAEASPPSYNYSGQRAKFDALKVPFEV